MYSFLGWSVTHLHTETMSGQCENNHLYSLLIKRWYLLICPYIHLVLSALFFYCEPRPVSQDALAVGLNARCTQTRPLWFRLLDRITYF